MSDALVIPVGPEASAGDPSREIQLGTTIAVLFFVFQRRIMNASAGAVKE